MARAWEDAPIVVEKERSSLGAYRVGMLLVFKAKKRRTAMARRYRKPSKKASPRRAGLVDQAGVLADRVHVELPVSLAEIIAGVSEDMARLSGETGLLIIQAVMKGEVDALAGPKGKHDADR